MHIEHVYRIKYTESINHGNQIEVNFEDIVKLMWRRRNSFRGSAFKSKNSSIIISNKRKYDKRENDTNIII